ncbi:MAG: PLDc N-terminal domain-containing protein [Rhodospirillaceae bacterium]
MGLEIGFFGLIWLAFLIWAGIHVINSNSAMLLKVIWILALIFLPLISFICWLLFGPRSAK